jgi:anthranilate phosphoribosyltransferase
MDELCSLSANSVVALGTAPAIEQILPERLGCHPDADPQSLAPAASKQEAAALVHSILSGNGEPASTQTVALNAAAVILLGNGACDLEEAYGLAIDALESGAPADLLTRMRSACMTRRSVVLPAAPQHQQHHATEESS